MLIYFISQFGPAFLTITAVFISLGQAQQQFHPHWLSFLAKRAVQTVNFQAIETFVSGLNHTKACLLGFPRLRASHSRKPRPLPTAAA
jgi:hypothetical protein